MTEDAGDEFARNRLSVSVAVEIFGFPRLVHGLAMDEIGVASIRWSCASTASRRMSHKT